MTQFSNKFRVPFPSSDVFDWHRRKGAFERLSPPWVSMTATRNDHCITNGCQVELEIKPLPGLGITWKLEHKGYEEGQKFEDHQISGPFSSWKHIHSFKSLSNEECELVDEISYKAPFGLLGSTIGKWHINNELERLFRYRETTLQYDLLNQKKLSKTPLNVAITGSRGMIGSALSAYLSTGGHSVTGLTHTPSKDKDDIHFDPDNISEEVRKCIADSDVVINLAGAPIAPARWTEERKEIIYKSRVKTTEALSTIISALDNPPKVFISCSGINYYGAFPPSGESLHEDTKPGKGFLSSVCQAWENATQKCSDKGIRTVKLRLAPVLSSSGGALSMMLPAFLACVGGPIGNGEQTMSWISLRDVIYVISHLIEDTSVNGPVNIASPQPLKQKDFANILGKVLKRPSIIPTPKGAFKLALGELAEETILSDISVTISEKLGAYECVDQTLETALRYTLGKGAK